MFGKSKIKSIKSVGVMYVYDISVHRDHSYHGNGICCHNSSSGPNLQNIPTRTRQDDEDVMWAIKQVKKFFKVPDGFVGLQFDFSQAELRLIANFSGDETMKSVYLEGKDIHSMTGARIAGMDYDSFLESENFKRGRNDAKSANFGLVYDISIPGYIAYIRNATGKLISEDTAKNHRDSLFGVYKKLKNWHMEYKAKAQRFGYVRTLFGRKRRLPDVNHRVSSIASKAMRNAINSPIQGSGGEWTIFVMALLDIVLPSKCYFFNTVHDSFFLYCPKDLVPYVCSLVKKYAEKPPVVRYFDCREDRLEVSMKIDLELSDKSWGDMEEQDLDKIISQNFSER